MNIDTAEISLVRFVAARCGMTANVTVFRGELPPGTSGAAVRFTTGHAAGADLAEFSAAVTACLAKGMTVTDALGKAEAFIDAALRGSFRMNQWSGALKHCAWREK